MSKRRRSEAGDDAVRGRLSSEGGASQDVQCIICLADAAVDRTLLPACRHSAYCFLCIVGWATLPRGGTAASAPPSCPLCKTAIGPYVLHHLRSTDDASRYYLRPPPSEFTLSQDPRRRPPPAFRNRSRPNRHISVQARSDRSEGLAGDEDDNLERTLAFRRRLYSHLVFSKHIASNSHTKFKPLPPPAAFRQGSNAVEASSSAPPSVGVSNWSPARLRSRALAFLRRELLLFPHLTLDALSGTGVPGQHPRHGTAPATPSLSFVATYIFSLLQSLDLRSESMTQLLAEFLCPRTPQSRPPTSKYTLQNEVPSSTAVAELFAHELASWIRSPYRRLEDWDRSEFLQYDFAAFNSELDNQQQQASTARPGRSLSRSATANSPPTNSASTVHGRLDHGSSPPPAENEQPLANTAQLRSQLLSRLEAERRLADSLLADRLANIPSESAAEPVDNGQPDFDKEERLRRALHQRRETCRLTLKTTAGADLHLQDAAAEVSRTSPGSQQREATLREMLHNRKSFKLK